MFFTVSEKNLDSKSKFSLVSDDGSTISEILISKMTATQLRILAVNFQKMDSLLIKFPDVIPATFVPVLKNLQEMQKGSPSPLLNWLLKLEPDNYSQVDVPPPAYACLPGFTFDLSPIMVDPTASLTFKPGVNVSGTRIRLKQSTNLDKGQCDALVAALSHEFALIQGPPGTGKSYVGTQLVRVLLQNKARLL
jgi:hypothetical protein